MNTRKIITAFLVASIIAAGSTIWLSRRLATHTASQLRYVVTARKMDTGEAFTSESVRLADWPTSAKLDGAFKDINDVVGRTAAYPLASGQPLLSDQLSVPSTNVGLSSHIPKGMRALSLKSDQVVGVAGYLLPGTHVDILVTFRAQNAANLITTTVLQDAQILTAGQKMRPDPGDKATPVDVVTVLVTPEQAERVVLASTQGSLHFVLRNGADHTLVANNMTHLSDLGNFTYPVKSPRQRQIKTETASSRKQVYSIEILRGDKQTVESF